MRDMNEVKTRIGVGGGDEPPLRSRKEGMLSKSQSKSGTKHGGKGSATRPDATDFSRKRCARLCQVASQPCPTVLALPHSPAPQPCPTALPHSPASQPCLAALPHSPAPQPCPRALSYRASHFWRRIRITVSVRHSRATQPHYSPGVQRSQKPRVPHVHANHPPVCPRPRTAAYQLRITWHTTGQRLSQRSLLLSVLRLGL